MSTRLDLYSVDETPVEGDPTNEEMMPVEERMLERIAFLRSSACAIMRGEEPEFKLALAQLEDYFNQTIAKRDGGCTACGMHWEACCCPVLDPFEDR